MIPTAHITQWRQHAPWMDDVQVEQDLLLSRIIVEIFSDPFLSQALAFRGGTALHKLFFTPSARYSEDIDLVRTEAGAIKTIVDALHERLDSWLGSPKTLRNAASFKLLYYFKLESSSALRQRIKIEINTREHTNVFDYLIKDFAVESDWFTGKVAVKTYQLEELLGTKLRALFQRKKGRDLFDLTLALKNYPDTDIEKIINCFNTYLAQQKLKVSRAMFEECLAGKLLDKIFLQDIFALLPQAIGNSYDPITEAAELQKLLICKLPGAPWKTKD